MKKICIFTCGGTITMKLNKKGALVPFQDHHVIKTLLTQAHMVTFDIKKIVSIDSSNMKPSIWIQLAQSIQKNYEAYDGFVITHGTDTMAYTASALSFALKNLNKPIIFTGAQKPVYDIASDAMNNLLNAVIVSTYDISGVYIVFGRKIIQGNRATKISESSFDAFDSPHVLPLGEIAFDIVLNKMLKTGGKKKKLVCVSQFDNNVIVTQLFPGITQQFLSNLLNAQFHGIILEAFGPGNVPNDLIPFIRSARKQNIPVVILSQCHHGITKMGIYEVGRRALKAGAIPANDMTVEAAVTKLMWVLAQTRKQSEVRSLMMKNIVGEITVN